MAQLGREASTAALIEAARRLFAAHGPSAVSLRDIAREAGVNHGLIHHYIGSKDDLLRLVVEQSTTRALEELGDVTDPVEAIAALRRMSEDDTFSRLLTWALLQGFDPGAFHGRSAAIEAIGQTAGDESRAVRIALAIEIVQKVGWDVLGRWALEATGLDDDDAEEVRRTTRRLVDQLLEQARADDG